MIIFVGDKPSPKMKQGAKPFEGAACEKRLKEWIRELIGDEEYIIVNKFDRPRWVFSMWWGSGAKVIALGGEASKVLNRYRTSHFKLPHPSGRNRQINDKEFIKRQLEACKKWLE
jgi:uracil-DNA glycosylase